MMTPGGEQLALPGASGGGEEVEPGRERPWRETDPRYADRRPPG